VLALVKIHGYALGMPNPGLLPTAKERAAQRDVVADAIARLERLGCEVDGQVAATRHPARVIASVARRRGVHHVIVEEPRVSRLRRLVEGDVVASVRRRLGGRVEIVVIDSRAGPAVGVAPPSPR
jgi:K+-sensing histidine kinase KdpD